MTPKFFYRATRKIESSNIKLPKLAFMALLAFVVIVILNMLFFDVLLAITLVPLMALFSVFGLKILKVWHKDFGELRPEKFDEFWQHKNIGVKAFYWYQAIFMSVWFAGALIIACFSVVHTVLLFYGTFERIFDRT